MLVLRRRAISVGQQQYETLYFVRVFSVEYSNMYNLSINELCILRGNMYIFPHNCIVCVRMVISFYPATRSHVHFSREVRSFCATAPASGRSGAGAGLGVLNSSVPLESLGPVQLPLFIFTFEVKMLRKFKSFGNQCKLTPSFEVSLSAEIRNRAYKIKNFW